MRTFLTVLFLIGIVSGTQAQKCKAQDRMAQRILENPRLGRKIEETDKRIEQWISQKQSSPDKKREIITIPVVVHVLWNESDQNISDEQIQSQIEVLNEDFRRQNEDRLSSDHPFYEFTEDIQMEFCLATRDPFGAVTQGITRTKTNIKSWNDNNYDDVFFSDRGGKNNWNPDHYLNMYVIEGDGETLGFASFPDELEDYREFDGVVIDHRVFGRTGTSGSEDFEGAMGRTATHEVGHWLNLWHIWGDEFCGDDKVSDTVPAEEDNYDCPSFPHHPNNECGSGPNGEMYMNYMDYVDDACAVMFTKGQGNRMRAVLAGLRSPIQKSNGCFAASYTLDQTLADNLVIYPNPALQGEVRIWLNESNLSDVQIIILDVNGREIFNTSAIASLNLNALSRGVYFLKIYTADRFASKKLIIQ
jgi:hypothetical protein